jgi:hypothetical protein
MSLGIIDHCELVPNFIVLKEKSEPLFFLKRPIEMWPGKFHISGYVWGRVNIKRKNTHTHTHTHTHTPILQFLLQPVPDLGNHRIIELE